LSAARPETTITPFKPVAFDSGVGNNETISPRSLSAGGEDAKCEGEGGGGGGRDLERR